MEDCDSVNFVQISLGWIVSISNSCLCSVDLTFSFFLCSSATVTAIERGDFFFFYEISCSLVVLFPMKRWTQISSSACETSLLFNLCFSCCRIWKVIDMRRKTVWVPHTSGFSLSLSFVNLMQNDLPKSNLLQTVTNHILCVFCEPR